MSQRPTSTRPSAEYHTHLALMDQVAATFDDNDGALLRLHERIKDALDPNSIMAPGNSGIWGARFRGRGLELGSPRILNGATSS
ncbi:MAG: FAD-linked oxidase C-terminal domain-containing protein [Arthrobacter sp.]|uniref:FAD-linked oxidase C-terminal domain-containing protein n=1 Tax=Arthrobacter sp. TaxID=1667 RepID=UPI003498F5BA